MTWLKALTAIALFISAVQGLAFPAPVDTNSAEAASTWADSNLASLPKDYDNFSTHTLTYRKAIYHRLDSDARANLWKAHWSQFRNSHSNLTPEQIKVLDDATAFIENPTTDSKVKDDLRNAADAAFGKTDAASIFATLGPADQAGESSNGKLVKRRPTCYCSKDSDFCDGDTQCRFRADSTCQRVPDECGLGWTYDCDGQCFQPV